MHKLLKHPLFILMMIILVSLAFRGYILSNLYLGYHLRTEGLFFFNLFNRNILIPPWLILILGVGNLKLLFLISQKIFNKRVALITAALYATSPWTAYLDSAGAFYIYLLFLILLSVFGLLTAKQHHKLGLSILLVGCLLLVYSSILMWLVVAILIVSIIRSKLLSPKDLKILLLGVLIMLMPLLGIMASRPKTTQAEINSRINFTESVGLINTVNQYRGELEGTKFLAVGRLVENRYFYLGEHLILTTLEQFSPATYFTSESRLLYFSANPPILLGFLIPFLLGLSGWVILVRRSKLLILVPLVLAVPSILYRYSPYLNRLIIISPIIFLTIAYGFNRMLDSQSKVMRAVLWVVIIAVVFQFLVVASDISLREGTRIQILREII